MDELGHPVAGGGAEGAAQSDGAQHGRLDSSPGPYRAVAGVVADRSRLGPVGPVEVGVHGQRLAAGPLTAHGPLPARSPTSTTVATADRAAA